MSTATGRTAITPIPTDRHTCSLLSLDADIEHARTGLLAQLLTSITEALPLCCLFRSVVSRSVPDSLPSQYRLQLALWPCIRLVCESEAGLFDFSWPVIQSLLSIHYRSPWKTGSCLRRVLNLGRPPTLAHSPVLSMILRFQSPATDSGQFIQFFDVANSEFSSH